MRFVVVTAFRTAREFTPKPQASFFTKPDLPQPYLPGICAAPDAGGAAGATADAGDDVAGICAAPDAAGAAGADVARSSTLPESAGVRRLPKYASASVHTKNTVASTAVVRERKFALPV